MQICLTFKSVENLMDLSQFLCIKVTADFIPLEFNQEIQPSAWHQ